MDHQKERQSYLSRQGKMKYFGSVKGTLKHDISSTYKYEMVENINTSVGVSRNLQT